jgi:hypothetical protein
MLANSNARDLIERVWQGLGCHVELPENWGDYFEHKGMVPSEYDDRRTFARMHFRGKAVFRHTDGYYAIYTRDVSRGGIAFYHMEQLFPAERARIWLANGFSHDVEIVRCRQRHRSCYECGAVFVSERVEASAAT